MRKIYQKMNLNTHGFGKNEKKRVFTVPFLGPSGGTKNETAKSQNQLPLADPCSEQQRSDGLYTRGRLGLSSLLSQKFG